MEGFSSILLYLELHVVCLIVIGCLYLGLRSGHRHDGSKVHPKMRLIYLSCVLVVLSDALWMASESFEFNSDIFSYAVNIVYFISSTTAVLFWLLYTLETVNSVIYRTKFGLYLFSIPAVFNCVLALVSVFTGSMFTIENGVYVRGPLFLFDPIIKMSYLFGACLVAVIYALKEKRTHLKKRYFVLTVYAVPVIVCGILQVTFAGFDFNCVGLTIGVVLAYVFGIANVSIENSDTIVAISNSYDASFVIDAEAHTIRTLTTSAAYSASIKRIEGEKSYEARIQNGIRNNVLPEDKVFISKNFDISEITRRLKDTNSYSLVYRVRDVNSNVQYHRATFIRAGSNSDRNEFMLCIQGVNVDQIVNEHSAKLAERNMELERINEGIISVAANIVEARDTESGQHIMRVREYVSVIAKRMMDDYPDSGLTPEKVQLITSASALHDIGKIMIPDSILLKPGPLTPEEYEIMKTHSARGCDVIDKLPMELDKAYLECAREVCRWHHEKYDGKGYPDGLKGEEIPLSAQIVSIADCYDAVTSKRVYKDAISSEEAYQLILNGKCGAFSDRLIDCFFKARKEIEEIHDKIK